MSKKDEKFAWDKKEWTSFLWNLEQKLVQKYTHKIPSWIETYHLTITTVIWSLGILLFCYLASYTGNMNWLWLTSLMIFLQYITDLFDGAVWRYRNTWLIKWWYYMDHFLDYIFLCSIVIGYVFIIPKIVFETSFFGIPIQINYYYFMFYLFMLVVGFMVSSYLSFAATNRFRISYLGIWPTEVRMVFIIINTFIILFGKTYMVWAMPYVLIFSFIWLLIVIYKTHKLLWEIDMEDKAANR